MESRTAEVRTIWEQCSENDDCTSGGDSGPYLMAFVRQQGLEPTKKGLDFIARLVFKVLGKH